MGTIPQASLTRLEVEKCKDGGFRHSVACNCRHPHVYRQPWAEERLNFG